MHFKLIRVIAETTKSIRKEKHIEYYRLWMKKSKDDMQSWVLWENPLESVELNCTPEKLIEDDWSRTSPQVLEPGDSLNPYAKANCIFEMIDTGPVKQTDSEIEFGGEELKGKWAFAKHSGGIWTMSKVEQLTIGTDDEIQLAKDGTFIGQAITDGVWSNVYFSEDVLRSAMGRYENAPIDIIHDGKKIGITKSVSWNDGIQIKAQLDDPDAIEMVKTKKYRYLSSDFSLQVDETRHVVVSITKVRFVSLCLKPVCTLCTIRDINMTKEDEEAEMPQGIEYQTWDAIQDVVASFSGVCLTGKGTVSMPPFRDAKMVATPWKEIGYAIVGSNGYAIYGNKAPPVEGKTLSDLSDLKWEDVAYLIIKKEGVTIIAKGEEGEYPYPPPAETPELDTGVVTLAARWTENNAVVANEAGIQLYEQNEKIKEIEVLAETPAKQSEGENNAVDVDLVACESANAELMYSVSRLEVQLEEMRLERDNLATDLSRELAIQIVNIRREKGIGTDMDIESETVRISALGVNALQEVKRSLLEVGLILEAQ